MPSRFLAPLALALAASCSVAPPGTQIHDPYESFNRQVHDFNKAVDRALFGGPGGADVDIPEEISVPVVNFADNVALPGMALNGLLQGNIEAAATNTFLFVLNTVVGVGGLVDVGAAIGLEEIDADFGQTLAVWGVPEGAYLELPLLGPSTERDLAGRIVDAVLDPLDRVGTDAQREFGTFARVAEMAIDRDDFAGTVEDVLYGSADSYAQTRLIYLQNRRFELGEAAGEGYTDTFIDPFEDLE